MKIAVLGGGHGGFASAVDLTMRGHRVSLFSFSVERVNSLNDAGGVLEYEGVWGEGRCKPALITSDMGAAVDGAELVMMNVPGTGHEKYLSELKKHLSPETILYMNPGHSGGALRAAHILGRGRIAEANTLSYIARKTAGNRVRVSSADKAVSVGVFPAQETEEVLAVIRQAYPRILTARDVLETSLSNINAVFHPPGVILNAGWIESTGGKFRFYYDGITPAVGRVIRVLDDERMAVAAAYGLSLVNFCTMFFNAGSTTAEAAEANDPYLACQQSYANQFIQAPPSLDHRYMHEDMGSGLLPISELGHLAGVAVPLTDALVVAAESMTGRDYHAEGVNLEKMGIAGLSVEQVLKFVQKGKKAQ
ncbi:MAG: NAD/NADP octopine/nopaline dehydrogenase family protein [Oscillospiraceae bacterium]|nr:NAD/NADP octopine/nopaline dehydrogenase family protein [Oscillospiraceae bacterium]